MNDMKIVAFTLISCLSFYLLFILVPAKKGTPVEILILDDFSKYSDHGKDVANKAWRWCLRSCNLRRFHTTADVEAYKQNLLGIFNYINTFPKKKFIVNISLGSYNEDLIEKQLISAINQENVIIVAAAGNDGEDNKEKCMYPAAYDMVIAVAATRNGKKAPYSNFGKQIDIAVNTRENISVRTEEEFAISGIEVTRIETRSFGTSLSSPKLAGMLGLVWSADPSMTKEEVLAKMKGSTMPMYDIYYDRGTLGVGELNDIAMMLNSPRAVTLMCLFAIEGLTLLVFFIKAEREWVPTFVFLNLILIISFLAVLAFEIPEIILFWGYLYLAAIFPLFLRICISLSLILLGKKVYISYEPSAEPYNKQKAVDVTDRLRAMGADVTRSTKHRSISNESCNVHISTKSIEIFYKSIFHPFGGGKVELAAGDWGFRVAEKIKNLLK